MLKLTDRQREILVGAAARADGGASVPAGLNKPAAMKLGTSLASRNLMREVRAKPDMPAWRVDDQGRDISLVLTRAGRKAIGGESQPAGLDHRTGSQAETVPQPNADPSQASRLPRQGSKQALVIAMLSREEGATLDALVQATAWLPHTTRAALTGLRKRGFEIERAKHEKLGSVYRLTQAATSAGA